MTDFILEEIARLFGHPCDHKSVSEVMFAHAITWCEQNCNKCSPKECWRKYFEIKKENYDGNR